MIIDTEIKRKVEEILQKKNESVIELVWQHLPKGFSNEKYIITNKENNPLYIFKRYLDDSIISPYERLRNEKKALKFIDNNLCPQLVWENGKDSIIYAYLTGKDLLQIQANSIKQEQIFALLENIHEKGKNSDAKIEDVLTFYQKLGKNYSVSLNNHENLLSSYYSVLDKLTTILQNYETTITYVHGDLVPPNIIFNGTTYALLDWEYYRPELAVFDFEYLLYYAEKHKLPIFYQSDKAEISYVYQELIKAMDNLWFENYKLQKNQ